MKVYICRAKLLTRCNKETGHSNRTELLTCADNIKQSILINYWMRLSMISGIIQTEVNVICRSEAEADNIDRGLNNS
jgi:hypothetical protein